MSALRVETAALLLTDPPAVWVAPGLLRALGLVPVPVEDDFAEFLELVATSPERAA